MSQLSPGEVLDTVRSILGLVRRLYLSELPDDFNVSIKVRKRHFKRMEIQAISNETAVVEPSLFIKKK